MDRASNLNEIAENIVEKALKLGATHSEAVVYNEYNNTTRFNNGIHQNIETQHNGAYITVVVDKNKSSSASLSTGKIDEKTVVEILNKIIRNAKLLQGDPNFHSLPEPKIVRNRNSLYYPDTVDIDPAEKASIIRDLIETGISYDKRVKSVDGYFVNGKRSITIQNSNGVNVNSEISIADIQIGVRSEEDGSNGSGYVSRTTRDISEIDIDDLTSSALDNALMSLNPKTVPAKEYEVVLKPSALSTLLLSISEGFSAETFNDGSSFLCGKLGSKLFSENLNLIDDGNDENSLTSLPFDGEGVPKERMVLVEGGIPESICYNHYHAQKDGVGSTGHCPHKIDRMDGTIYKNPIPMNQLVLPGDADEMELIEEVNEGLLVTRMHYVTVIDETKAILSGMTRDGTWLIRDGEIQHPVRDLRFMDSMIDVLSKIDLIGNESIKEKKLREHSGLLSSITTPPIKVSSIKFTGQTR